MQSSEVNKTGLSVCKKNTHYRFKKKKRESKQFEVCHAPVLVNDTVPSKKKKTKQIGSFISCSLPKLFSLTPISIIVNNGTIMVLTRVIIV